MIYILHQFERNLKSYIESCSFDKVHCSLIFEKKNTDNPFGDFSAFLFNNKCKTKPENETCVTNVFHEIKGLELYSKTKHWSLIIDSIKLDCNRLILKLNREYANRTGLELVNRTNTEYGTNGSFRDKVFKIKQENVPDKVGLTDLRTELTAQLLKSMILTGGGTVVDENKTDLEGVNLLNVGRKCFGENSVTVGAVKTISNDDLSKNAFLTAEDYRKLRINDIIELSEHKEHQNEDLQQLVDAALCFDLLSTKVDKPVTLDVFSKPMSIREHSTKGATFVLYNYARICAIVDQFHDKVAQKIYDPLPPIIETSTELLIQKEEWSLMFDYILEWPEIVYTCQNVSSLKLHNICGFLSSLSLCFSAFYRRCRILTDPLPQLLPLMYARIHLILALRQIYQNAFKLLSIKAPSHM